MANKKIASTIPIYAAGIVWLLWSMALPLYAPLHFIGAAAASLAVYVLGRCLIWKDYVVTYPDADGKGKEADKTAQPKQEAAKKQEPAVSPEVAALRAERDRAVGEMKRLNASIADPKISAQIDHLEEVTGKILDYVAEHPEKQSQIRKFLDYYLPTTLKLLNAYDRMDSAGISGANIDGTKGKVEKMMDTIVTAFDRQLDALFGDEALDIATDITVLERMLSGEGLTGSDFQAGAQ
ncbi:5-bromo-4-chloroindolyl phosphate hydrolysis family protein [Pseudoflavonifractor sp. MSJ-37]|uniref:5-bromo-4-chloroindolyl phosphate hydrolysis family protein n=1 Tax=Pseudoflavonifractor sp. MSJ-37 TaxID=2841531 RepID=UPI001C1031C7|nr:5-bromo-4-chloroindolyl phosphate hydrolysis family protein [Pseudoflavonifractor sp. MSJ-37]MBU5436213.1 5-bromo-4-chloroindolyl phosphate hydrolysis family protein [Pseudoflavonifractor sp. MSJ-37]